jgi:hypothetical protein
MIDRRLVAALALLATSACGRNGPTEPLPANHYEIAAHIRHADGKRTLLRYQSFLDGSPLSAVVSPGAPVSEATVTGAVDSVPSGTYLLSVRVLDQTVSPSPYILSDVYLRLVTVDSSGVNTPSWSFWGVQIPGTLATRESIYFRIRQLSRPVP